VGPTAEGEIPAIQQASLRGLGRWMATMGPVVRSAGRLRPGVAEPGDEPWVRWLDTSDALVALVDQPGRTPLSFDVTVADPAGATLLSGEGSVTATADGLSVEVTALGDGPAAVSIPWSA